MARPPKVSPEEKVTIVLGILSGTTTAADAARGAGVSDQAVCSWKRRFIAAGQDGLEGGGVDQRSRREQRLVDEIVELRAALGDSYRQLQALRARVRGRLTRAMAPGARGVAGS